MPDRLGVAILGMGRSGTSAVAGTFVAAGYFAGAEEDLLGANEGNPRGHHENLGVLRTNEEVLHELGGSWYRPPDLEVQAAAAQRLSPRLRGEVRRLLSAAGERPLVVKDPRIGVLMPIWRDVLDEYLHPVLVVRDPVEIARSLRRRDGTPLPFGLAMWETHMALVLDYLHERAATVVSHRELLGEPAVAGRVVASASAHLAPSRAEAVDVDSAAAALDPELHRSVARVSDHPQMLTARQAELWALLEALPSGDRVIHVPDHLRRRALTAEGLVRCEQERLERAEDYRRLWEDRDAHRGRADELAQALHQTQDELAQAREQAQRATSEQHRLAAELAELERRHHALLRRRAGIRVRTALTRLSRLTRRRRAPV